MDKINNAGFVKKGDTLLGYRQMVGLTLKAFAGEMGMTPTHYEMLETGKWKVKFYHLKAALTIVRFIYLQVGINCDQDTEVSDAAKASQTGSLNT